MINTLRLKWIYVIGDFITANIAILIFNICRYYLMPDITPSFVSLSGYLHFNEVILGQIFLPALMLSVYHLSGYYNVVFTKSRLQELLTTISTSFIGTTLIFFIVLINDMQTDRYFNYEILLLLYLSLFLPTYFVRLSITRVTSNKIHSRQWTLPTLIVGTSEKAQAYCNKLDSMKRSMGYKIVGYVATNHGEEQQKCDLPVYTLNQLPEICNSNGIKSIIIVHQHQSEDKMLTLLNKLLPLDLPIFISPDTLHLLTSRIRQGNIAGEPLIDISCSYMSQSTINLKRFGDILVSAITLIIISPIIVALAIAIKIDSKGPIFYKQTRIGYHKRPFKIFKLRSMHTNAEESGPALSTEDDPRITRIGRFMRKYRLDELPQFWNVLRGEMSLVGPRPEREYYIQQIIKRAPYYTLLHRVRPGITSWGMVKYGYASTIDEMIERLHYDLIYIENISILVDIKIIIYTIHTVFTGKGI